MDGAKIHACLLSFQGAEKQPAWIVEANEPEGTSRIVFMGHNASERATKYARESFGKVHFVMHAEPGVIGARVGSMNGA
jgi:hypothetical protein